jgi:type II secretory pathway pseudopilin PulG
MNLTHMLFQTRRGRRAAAFTLIEIALSLAVIGFALVAIIGILPTGLTVQKENREETLINFEAAFLMDAIRNGSRGQEDLTNYVMVITNRFYHYTFNRAGTNLDTAYGTNHYNAFTYTNYELDGVAYSTPFLTNGANIVGLLSTPKYEVTYNRINPADPNSGTDPSSGSFTSNYVSADFRSLSGPVVDQGVNAASRDFAFRYRVEPEIVGDSPFDSSWVDFNLAGLSAAEKIARSNYWAMARNLQGNVSQARLRFKWPILANGKPGNGRQVFRTAASGSIVKVTGKRAIPFLYYVQPQTYAAQP